MSSLIKFIVFICGCAAIYGLTTGQDLNVLFEDLMEHFLPAAENLVSGIWQFMLEAIKQ